MNSNYLEAGKKACEWMNKTQIKNESDANRGRFIYAKNLTSGETEYSTNWTTGFGAIAMLSMYKLTNDKQYLNSSEIAMEYLKSLQIIDPGKPELHGAIREEIPQTNWLHPRDALSAAWAFLVYGKATCNSEMVRRASLFADWMLNYAFMNDWPICTVKLGKGGRKTDDLLGSFQSGGILFFLDMYHCTGNINYYDAALRMCDFYVENFIDEKGNICVLYDAIGNNPDVNNTEKWPLDWQEMHRVNDDFGGISLVEAFRVFKKESYRKRSQAYFKKLQGYENGDGSYSNPEIEVGAATASIFLQQYKTIADVREIKAINELLERSLNHLCQLQLNSDDKAVNGALYGMDSICHNGHREWINIRVTVYAVFALLQDSDNSSFPISFK